jgi:hypothetical protein
MPTGPKETELKIKRMINAWEELAPEKSFGGMTLDQFKAVAAPSLAARATLADLYDQTAKVTTDRDNGDDVFNEKAQLVVNGVLADPTEGPNSAIYERFGYTRKSERQSGLTRKGGSAKGGTSSPPAKP